MATAHPQPARTGNVTPVAVASHDQRVQLMALHLGQASLAPLAAHPLEVNRSAKFMRHRAGIARRV